MLNCGSLFGVAFCYQHNSQRLYYPFLAYASECFSSAFRSVFEHAKFVESAIFELSGVGSAVEYPGKPTVVYPLSVSVQFSGKKRLILDLQYPNGFLIKFIK